jgi:hypothetical protein
LISLDVARPQSRSKVYSSASTLVISTSSPLSSTISFMRAGPQPSDRRGCLPLQTGKDPRSQQLLPVSPLLPADPGKATPKSFVSRTSKTKDFKSLISRRSEKMPGGPPSSRPSVGQKRESLFPSSPRSFSEKFSHQLLPNQSYSHSFAKGPGWGYPSQFRPAAHSPRSRLGVSVPLWPIPAVWSGGDALMTNSHHWSQTRLARRYN